jgi:hypothetical protein
MKTRLLLISALLATCALVLARPPATPVEIAYYALPTTQPEPMSLPDAIKTLRESEHPMKLVSAAAAIANSNDDVAWKALQEFLVSPERTKPLEVTIEPRKYIGSSQMANFRPYFLFVIKAIAEAQPARANQMLLWLANQSLYQGDSGDSETRDRRFRGTQIYNALQFLKRPDEKVLALCTSKLADKVNRDSEITSAIMEALIVWSSPESLKLFENHLELASPLILLLHRDNPTAVKLYVDGFARFGYTTTAANYVYQLLSDTYSRDRSSIFYRLPPWPQGPEAAKIADTLETLPAKISPPKDQTDRLNELIKKLRASSASAPAPQTKP